MKRPAALAIVIAIGALGIVPSNTPAAPVGGEVVGGSASIRTNGVQTDIVQSSARAVIDWRRFDIGTGESVHFRQPDARSVTLNRVTGGDPSQIFGALTANGQVILLNPNGVLFGREARVDTAGLVVSTARLGTADFMAGRLGFTPADRPGGSVVNQGNITVREGGVAAFVAPHVRNEGSIRADLGRVMLASGSSFTLDLTGDGLVSLALREADLNGLIDVNGRAVTTLVENTGALVARSGQVVVVTPSFASRVIDHVINLGGVVRADAVEQGPAGTIVLKAANGQIQLPGEIAAPGGVFSMQRDDALTGIEGELAAALGRVLRNGTNVAVDATGRIDVAGPIDGRGGASGAGLRLTGSNVALTNDIYTQDGAVEIHAVSGAIDMRKSSGFVPGRDWPLIMTGRGNIRLSSEGHVEASYLLSEGHVFIESRRGNVRVKADLGTELIGAKPLASLTIRALGTPEGEDVGNVRELRDVRVAPGGRIDIAASLNIRIVATGRARPGIDAARRGIDGRSLRLASNRLGTGDLVGNADYWSGGTSALFHVERGASAEDAAGRWTQLRLTKTKSINDPPSAGAPPGPVNVLASTGLTGNASLLGPVAGARTLDDVLPAATTVIPGVDIANTPADTNTGVIVQGAPGGYSVSRGVAQRADTGRARATSSTQDIFALAEHVVEVPACVNLSLSGDTYFRRGVFGQALDTTCR